MSVFEKKEILQTIIRKKVIIENNYFNISSILEDIIANSEDQNIIKIAKKKQDALDNAINFAISELETLIQNFIDSLQTNDIQKHIEIEKQLKEEIDKLNIKTKELNDDLEKARIVNEKSDNISNNAYYGSLDNVSENEVNNIFGNKATNEIKDLRNGKLIESLNEPTPQDAIAFNEIYFDEVSSYNDYKKNQKELNEQIRISNELAKMGQHAMDQQLYEIEKRLMNEINKLKTSNQFIEETNDAILSKMNDNNPATSENNLIDTKSFDMLDVAINNMISKIELAKIPDYRDNNISNLENIGQTIIKSLETNLDSLSKDVENLKQENFEYRTKISEYLDVITNLKNDRMMKEQELNESYASWVSSNKKLQDLETLLGQQSVDISELDGQKNIIIDSLEKKLRDTINSLNDVLSQNEELINRQEELQEFIRVNDIRNEYDASIFDKEVETKSLQELVEKEANKIVESKMNAMLDRYKNELDILENEVRKNIKGIDDNKDILAYEFEKQNNNTNDIKQFEEKIKKFENKINKLEDKLDEAKAIEYRTRETIDNINELLEYDQIKEDVMETEVGQKLQMLEKMINETATRIETQHIKSMDDLPHGLTDKELEKIIKKSDIYTSVQEEINRLEMQVNSLKNENMKIKKENFQINTELDDSFQRFTHNTNKMKQVEELLNNQMDEIEKLNVEKDELILALEEKIKENEQNQVYVEQEETPYVEYIEQADQIAYNESLERENIELLINKTVNEILANKAMELLEKQSEINNQYEKINNINNNDYYGYDFIQNEEMKNKPKSTRYTISEDEYYDLEENTDDDNSNKLLVSQSFSSTGYKEDVNKPSIVNKKIKSNTKQNKKEQLLENEILEIQEKYNELLKETEKRDIENSYGNYQQNSIPSELLENTERLRNFERLLIQIDNEISNLENDSLNKFLTTQI